ncbi:MAG TPA: hypothetical protein QKA08_01455 [Candidatus Megaira endosymbiont of Nemacystus decipiens]|nr:hypothetical protein [Candidatus Megaera endosymbiont of Nemacystus decipiens]
MAKNLQQNNQNQLKFKTQYAFLKICKDAGIEIHKNLDKDLGKDFNKILDDIQQEYAYSESAAAFKDKKELLSQLQNMDLNIGLDESGNFVDKNKEITHEKTVPKAGQTKKDIENFRKALKEKYGENFSKDDLDAYAPEFFGTEQMVTKSFQVLSKSDIAEMIESKKDQYPDIVKDINLRSVEKISHHTSRTVSQIEALIAKDEKFKENGSANKIVNLIDNYAAAVAPEASIKLQEQLLKSSGTRDILEDYKTKNADKVNKLAFEIQGKSNLNNLLTNEMKGVSEYLETDENLPNLIKSDDLNFLRKEAKAIMHIQGNSNDMSAEQKLNRINKFQNTIDNLKKNPEVIANQSMFKVKLGVMLKAFATPFKMIGNAVILRPSSIQKNARDLKDAFKNIGVKQEQKDKAEELLGYLDAIKTATGNVETNAREKLGDSKNPSPKSQNKALRETYITGKQHEQYKAAQKGDWKYFIDKANEIAGIEAKIQNKDKTKNRAVQNPLIPSKSPKAVGSSNKQSIQR